MRRIFGFVVPVLITAALSLWPCSAFSGNPKEALPKVEVTPTTFDFGTVDEGEKPKAVFSIKNTGNAELVIYDAKPSCGCTLASLSSKKLAPGDKAKLEAVFNSQNTSGQIHKFVDVHTNDPKTPSVTLTITGNVKAKPGPDIALSAYNVSNLQLAAGGSAAYSVKVTNPGQLDLVINEVSATPGATAKLDSVVIPGGQAVKTGYMVKPGAAVVLDITISPSVKSGNFQEFVTIRSNAPRRPVITFIAQGVVQG